MRWCLPKEVTDEKLLDFICALTALCNRLLGTEVPVKGGEHLEVRGFQTGIGVVSMKKQPQFYLHHLPTSLHDLTYCYYYQDVIHVGRHVGSM